MFLTLITLYLFTKKRKLINVHPLGARTSVQITLSFKSFKYKFASLNSRPSERASANLISKQVHLQSNSSQTFIRYRYFQEQDCKCLNSLCDQPAMDTTI